MFRGEDKIVLNLVANFASFYSNQFKLARSAQVTCNGFLNWYFRSNKGSLNASELIQIQPRWYGKVLPDKGAYASWLASIETNPSSSGHLEGNLQVYGSAVIRTCASAGACLPKLGFSHCWFANESASERCLFPHFWWRLCVLRSKANISNVN